MKLATDVIFLGLSSINNDLFVYVCATSEGGESKFVGTTELKNIPYIIPCTVNFSVKETGMLRLKISMFRFLEGSKYIT